MLWEIAEQFDDNFPKKGRIEKYERLLAFQRK